MWSFVVLQLRGRWGRAAVLGVGILVAAVAFTLLTAATRTSELQVRGAIARSFRPAYDILVRPRGSETEFERRDDLVRDNYLSGIFGGITLNEYARIKAIRGVAVAAPIANLGYMLPFVNGFGRINRLLTRAPEQLYRVHFTWVGNGVSRYPDPSPEYVEFTTRDAVRSNELAPARYSNALAGEKYPGVTVPGHRPVDWCNGFQTSPSALPAGRYTGPFALEPSLNCFAARAARFSASWNLAPRGAVGYAFSASFPVEVAAIDPVQEARLLHLNRAIVAGSYLGEGESAHAVPYAGARQRLVPVIASSRTFVREALQVRIQRLRIPAGVDVQRALSVRALLPDRSQPVPRVLRFLTGLSGPVIARRRVSFGREYHRMLDGGPLQSYSYWTVSPTRYRQLAADRLAPIAVRNPISVWKSPWYPGSGDYQPAPPDNRDVQFRRLHAHTGNNQATTGVLGLPSLKVVGQFDASRLPGFNPLSRVPLETYYPPDLTAGSAAASAALHGGPFGPTQNLGGYVAQPPLMLTTLAGLRTLESSTAFSGTSAQARAPISVIRVRVADVTGPNAVSRERINLVAQQIHDQTDLQVNITAGSSPHQLTIDLPAGRFGQPPLVLHEGWIKTGVAVTFLRALDRKDLALFALVLIVCALFLANGTFAAVRARRREIGTLACLGWGRYAIVTAILGELVVIGLVAGISGAILAAVLAAVLGIGVSAPHVLLVIAIAVALALIAGIVPAWRGTTIPPLDAVRPPVSEASPGRSVGRLWQVALVNLIRLPARTILGASGLALGVAALALLVAIQASFQGELVGTLLGNAISIQVHGADYVSVGLTIALAALSTADVLALNLRERAGELATIHALGWRQAHLRRLIALEAAGIALTAGLAGAMIAILLGALALSLPLGTLIAASAAAGAAGALTAIIASLGPVAAISRLPPTTLLAAE